MDRARGARPEDDTWRTDFKLGSHHSRWIDELRRPLESHDRERAAEICGEVARGVLQDFAPALALVATPTRRRLQAIAAYTLTLFDFARQSGLEGERLTAINRWEFDLEAALDGEPPGQPVYVLIHEQEERRPWPREAFDLLHAGARSRSIEPRPADRRTAEKDASRLARALVWLILNQEPSPAVTDFAAAVIRLRGLLNLGDDLRRHQARLPRSELADSWMPDQGNEPNGLQKAIEDECRRLASELDTRQVEVLVPRQLRAATRYTRQAALHLVKAIQTQGIGVIENRPRLGLARRLRILVRARWL